MTCSVSLQKKEKKWCLKKVFPSWQQRRTSKDVRCFSLCTSYFSFLKFLSNLTRLVIFLLFALTEQFVIVLPPHLHFLLTFSLDRNQRKRSFRNQSTHFVIFREMEKAPSFCFHFYYVCFFFRRLLFRFSSKWENERPNRKHLGPIGLLLLIHL